jgi:arylsulfatase A-like enzyme
MRALALGVTLIVAKGLSLSGHVPPAPGWAVSAYLWQDVALAALFWAVDRLAGRPRWMWAPYAAIVAGAAIDVPVARVLGSPLTLPMLRAAGGPLADSIAHEATPANLAAIAIVLALGATLPALLCRVPWRVRRAAVVVSLVTALAGPLAATTTDTRGRDRNVVTAITATLRPRITALAADQDWRNSPFDDGNGEDLTRFHGSARGSNVVIVVLESTAARYLRAYGAVDDPTPNLTALAQRALLFENAYTAYPESVKGMVATFESRYPAFDVAAEAHATTAAAPLARLLGSAGYRTALFHSGRFAYLGMDAIVGAQGFELAEDAGAIGGNIHSSFGVDEPSTVRRMLSWIDALPPGQPFFATYMPVAGHHPYATPEAGPFHDAGELGAYKNALHYGDKSLGDLVSGLAVRHLLDHTILLIFGDHGEAFGQHDGNFGHTLFVYDENVRVPLVVVLPHATDEIRVRRVASTIDIAPTVLDLLGLPASPRHQGVSLLAPRRRMSLFFSDYAVGWLGVRDGCWKDMFEVESGRSRLFDICADPDESHDRAPGLPDRVAAYRARLQAWSAASRAAILSQAAAGDASPHRTAAAGSR